MAYKTLDPEVAAAAIEGYQNELAPDQKANDAFYRQFRCKRCGGACQKETDPKHAFSDPSSLTPRSLLRCLECRCLFDPHSALILEMGNLAKVTSDVPIIRPRED